MAYLDKLDKLDEKFNQIGQGLLQKPKVFADTVGLNSAIKEEEKKIESYYIEIGRGYCEKYGIEMDVDFQQTFQFIVESKKKIEDYQEQIRIKKGIENCPNCHGEVAAGSAFCNHCGFKMPEKPAPMPKKNQCVKCGTFLEEGQLFCTNCGTRVGMTEPPLIPEPEPVDERRCQVCGTPLEEGQVFCVECGAKIEMEAEPAGVLRGMLVEKPVVNPQESLEDKLIEEPVLEEIRRCPKCGEPVEEGQRFCIMCGEKME